MFIGTDHFTESICEDRYIRKCLLCIQDHPLEGIHGVSDIFTSCFGTFNAKAQLKIFFISNENISKRGYFGKGLAQFSLPSFPKSSSVIEIKRDQCAMFFCIAGDLQTEVTGVGRKCGDESGEMHNLYTLHAEDPFEIEIFYIQCPAYFTGTVILHAGTP